MTFNEKRILKVRFWVNYGKDEENVAGAIRVGCRGGTLSYDDEEENYDDQDEEEIFG